MISIYCDKCMYRSGPVLPIFFCTNVHPGRSLPTNISAPSCVTSCVTVSSQHSVIQIPLYTLFWLKIAVFLSKDFLSFNFSNQPKFYFWQKTKLGLKILLSSYKRIQQQKKCEEKSRRKCKNALSQNIALLKKNEHFYAKSRTEM